MTLTRRLALLIAVVLLPALLGSLLVHTVTARDALLTQLRLRNLDAAGSLAVALSQQRGDMAGMQAVVFASFDLGHYRRLALLGPDGAPVVDRQSEVPAHNVPAWFAAAFALEAEAGAAPVSNGWQPIGTVRVESHGVWALEALWSACVRTAGLLALLAAAAALMGAWLLRGVRAPLAATVAQAQEISQARFVTAEEPAIPELRDVTRAMNSMVRRLRELFDAQAEQVVKLQQQAQTDPVSGLPVRAQFMVRLGDLLADPSGPPSALLLARVPNLERLNERHGREATDRLLHAVADVLLTYVERVPGTFAGRLNGTDFGLCLPAGGIAQETADSLRQAFEASPAARLAGVDFVIGGCDGLRGTTPGAALAAADAALAAAEQGEGTSVVGLPDAATGGSRAWRERIASALAQSRVQIGAFPVVDARGSLIHLECPLRVQLEPGGEYQVARRWLALAARSRLMPEVDLAAVDRVLTAIATDGWPRAVHVAPRSLTSPEFAAALQSRLEARAELARKLSIEWSEGVRPEEHPALRAAVVAWRRAGVTVGVEHAGASPKALPPLKEIGVDYVKVDSRHLRGLADDEAVRGYAQGLVALIHGLGLKAIAEGIDEPRDLLAVWALGFDGATGAAVPSPGS